jgi:hypothetical protein
MASYPPFVDVETIRDQIVEFYDSAPYHETLRAILQVTRATYELLSELWPEGAEGNAIRIKGKEFDERLVWYLEAVDGADEGDEDVLTEVVLDPLFDGEYHDEGGDSPSWPDIDTLWRLMNQTTALTLAQLPAGEGGDHDLLSSYRELYSIFWGSIAGSLDIEAESLPEDFETMRGDLEAASDSARSMSADSGEDAIAPQRATSGSGALALGVLGIGALMLLSSHRRR